MASGFFEACASNVLATVFVDYLVKPTVRPFSYVFQRDKIVEKLRKHSKQLALKQESVERDVQQAKNRIEEIDKVVEDWLTDALKVQKDIESFELEGKAPENKRGFIGCPDLSWRYRRSKQAAEKILAVSELMMNSEFPHVGHPADLPGVRFLPSKEFLPSQSANLAENQIMEALKDDGVNIIGLWGMGGIGKTTLVNEVGRKAKDSQLFGEVVNVVVSQNQNIEKIQDRIADLLNFSLDKKTEDGKAEQLWIGLKTKQSILIILDDLWKELDLKAVGIPIGEHHRGCKILLTTRSQEVCSNMNSGRDVHLNFLDEAEAWKLFKKSAELDDNTSNADILKKAAKVAKECKGLPLALSTLGKALKGQKIHQWRKARRNLKSSIFPDIGCEEDKHVYKCLRWSYDSLKSELQQICFLLCSTYPEDFSIPVEDLARYVWGLELIEGGKAIRHARDEVYTALDKLKDSSLLLDAGRRGDVKMHDMVRDVAIWIASQKESRFVIKSEAGASEWPRNDFEPYCTAISLWRCKIKEINPEGVDYPKLELFSISMGEEDTMTLSGASFHGMKSLKVLDLVFNGSLSQDTLRFLTTLRCLYLEYCKLNTYSISSLGELKKLEILSFRGSNIEVLPDKVGELGSLRLLDLSYCKYLKRIPAMVIPKLSRLEELYLAGCGYDGWLMEPTNAEVSNASLFELNELSNLAILVLRITDAESFPKDFVFRKVTQCYSIAIGRDTMETYPSKRCLNINKSIPFNAFKNLVEDVEWLELGSIPSCQNIVPSQGVFKSLSILRISSCDDMECIVDARNRHVPVAFSNLSVLEIIDMDSFQQLCNGPPPNGFLKNLESLKIEGCCSVKSLFPSSVMRSLVQLKSLEIAGCHMLERIFEEMEGANEVLQKLQSLKIKSCDSLKSLFPLSVAQTLVRLESLQIVDCPMLEQIFEQMEGATSPTDQPLYLLPKLKTLAIEGCSELTLECFIDATNQHLPGFGLLNLEKLVLKDMTCLKWLCNGESPKGFLQKLRSLEIIKCSIMTSLFPSSFAQHLVQLKNLQIQECNIVERLVTEADFEMLSNNRDHSPCLQQLSTLRISGCCKLEYIFPSSLVEDLPRGGKDRNDVLPKVKLPSLQELCLRGCPRLRPFCPVSSQLKWIRIDDCGGESSPVEAQPDQNSQDMEYAVFGNVEEMFQLQEGNILSNLSHFRVWGQPELRVIWSRPKQVVTLQNLVSVELRDCKRLRYVFSPTLARSLPMLYMLWIEECEELEQIVDTSAASSHLQPSISFPHLISIRIGNCNSLKYLFPISIHHHEQEGRAQLSKLEYLRLKELPNLISFSSVDYHVEFPSLRCLEVKKCPQMTTTFTIDLQGFTHAKASQQIDDSVASRETTWARGSDIWWEKPQQSSMESDSIENE